MTAKTIVRNPAVRQSTELDRLLLWADKLAAARHPLTEDSRRREGLVLTSEAGVKLSNPPWPMIESVVRGLTPASGNRFCCLSLPGSTYIQALRESDGNWLERRVASTEAVTSYRHLRASCAGRSANSGEDTNMIDVNDVVDAFREFCINPASDGWLDWRTVRV